MKKSFCFYVLLFFVFLNSSTVLAETTSTCVFTQGYWKTHSILGKAPYDNVWAFIGENTIFFKSEKTYYEVLWTPPKGNVYYQLAHQYIAAKLNIRKGAYTPLEVKTAFNDATNKFEDYAPSDTIIFQGSEKEEWIILANILTDFNEVAIGTGECVEQNSLTGKWLFRTPGGSTSYWEWDMFLTQNEQGFITGNMGSPLGGPYDYEYIVMGQLIEENIVIDLYTKEGNIKFATYTGTVSSSFDSMIGGGTGEGGVFVWDATKVE